MIPSRFLLGLSLLLVGVALGFVFLGKGATRGIKEASPRSENLPPLSLQPSSTPPSALSENATTATAPLPPSELLPELFPSVSTAPSQEAATAPTSPFSSEEVTLANPPRMVEFNVFRQGNQETTVRGVTLSSDGKVFALAHLFAGAQAVFVSDDPTHTACLGWQASDLEKDWLVIKLREETSISAHVVAPSYLALAPGDALVLPLPRKDAPNRGITAVVASAPDGTPGDPAAADLWIAVSPEELVLGTPVLDRHRYLVGLIDAIRPELHLAHVVKVAGPMAVLDRAAYQTHIFAWNEKGETPLPFADASLRPETVENLQSLQGPGWERACEEILKAHGDSPLAWYEAALGYDRNGEPERALASARMLTRIAPKLGKGWLLLGKELDEAKDYAGALDAYQNAVENGVQPAETALPLAAALLHSGDTAGALDQLLALSKEEPDIYEVWLALGNAQESAGHPDEAIEADLHALRLDPQSVPAWTALASIYDRQGDRSDAAESYKQLLLLTPRDATIWRHFGQLQAKESAADARRSFHNVTLLDPGDRDAWIELARLSEEEGDSDEAEADSRKALELDPRSAPAWRQLGEAELNQNRSDQAEIDWNHAVDLDPNDTETWRDLARLRYRHGGLKGAESALAQLEKIAPDEAVALKSAWNQEGDAATPAPSGE